MHKILTLNNISLAGLEELPRDRYEVASEIRQPDAILLRSFDMHTMEIPTSLKAVGRAGAGINNIPVNKLSELGIPVFNAPGANANAVKELVIAAMLLACRNIPAAWDFTRQINGDDQEIHRQVEMGKKQFRGFELPAKVIGVIGLGAIGIQVCNAAHALGMKVIGYDPQITVERAWQLSSEVEQASSIDYLLSHADFISLHVPLLKSTKNLINSERLAVIKKRAILLNFARDGIVDNQAVIDHLNNGKLYAYACDFPATVLKNHPKVISLPHLGASTIEAEENCAKLVVRQIKSFLETGNIRNSVNFPQVEMPGKRGFRLLIVNKNVPNMLGQISTELARANLNIVDMLNKSREQLAYTLVDVETQVSNQVVEQIMAIDGVLSVRMIEQANY